MVYVRLQDRGFEMSNFDEFMFAAADLISLDAGSGQINMTIVVCLET